MEYLLTLIVELIKGTPRYLHDNGIDGLLLAVVLILIIGIIF